MQLLPHIWDTVTGRCLRCGHTREADAEGIESNQAGYLVLYRGYCPPMTNNEIEIGHALGQAWARRQKQPEAKPTEADLALADQIGQFLGKQTVH